jgi:predicted nucleic acid-binding protein
VTRYLVDTNVISAIAPAASVPRTELIAWIDSHSAELFLSAITIAEIADGIAKLKRENATRKAADLSAWLQTVLHLYGDHGCPSTVRQLKSLACCPIWRAAAVMLRVSPMSPSPQRRGGTISPYCHATSAISLRWM